MDGAAIQTAAAAFAGIDHTPGLAFQKKARNYLWRETANGHEPIGVQDIATARASGDVRMMVAMGDNKSDVGVLQLFVPIEERN